MTTYTNSTQIIDRIEKLVSDVEAHYEEDFIESLEDVADFEDVDFVKSLISDHAVESSGIVSELVELVELLEFQTEASSYNSDWKYGFDLIESGKEEEYFQDYLESCGEIPKDLPSYIVIDWESTAENLLEDYAEYPIDGTTYYFRCT